MRWAHDIRLWVELFATVNLAILAADIYIAHSVNQFQKAAEYIPLFFSVGAPIFLSVGIALRWIWRLEAPWRDFGYLIGWLSILVGLGGVFFHLQSRFFFDHTIKSLTYAAPFAAPLAYTGLGFLLLVNRMCEVIEFTDVPYTGIKDKLVIAFPYTKCGRRLRKGIFPVIFIKSFIAPGNILSFQQGVK